MLIPRGNLIFATGGISDPTEIANLDMWYRADLGVTGDPVTAWADQSGNSRDLDTVAGTPDFLSNEINGHPAIDFVPNEMLRDATVFTTSFPTHVFMVVRPDAYTSSKRFLDMATDGTGAKPSFVGDGDSIVGHGVSSGNIDADATGAPAVGNWGMIHGVWGFDGSNGDIKTAWDDGSYTTAASGALTASNGIALGAMGSFELHSDCAISEVIVYSAELVDSDLTNLLGYLQTRYALW